MKAMRIRALVALGSTAVSAASFSPVAGAETSYFSFVSTASVRTKTHEFVFAVEDPTTIAQLRDIVVNAGDIPARNQRVTGTIVTTRADYNAEWPFHFVPSTVRLTQGLDVETCDATPFEIEENLHLVGGAFLPNAFWCPWSMRVVREVQAPR